MDRAVVIGAGCTLLLLFSANLKPQDSHAAPRRPQYQSTGNCACSCVTMGGDRLTVAYKPVIGLSCSAFDNKTCNFEDQTTKEIRTGELMNCTAERKEIPAAPGGVKSPDEGPSMPTPTGPITEPTIR
jgi:hypothetical protein